MSEQLTDSQRIDELCRIALNDLLKIESLPIVDYDTISSAFCKIRFINRKDLD